MAACRVAACEGAQARPGETRVGRRAPASLLEPNGPAFVQQAHRPLREDLPLDRTDRGRKQSGSASGVNVVFETLGVPSAGGVRKFPR